MKNISYILISILLLASCEKVIDFPIDSSGRIFIDAVLGDHNDQINVMVSHPITGYETAKAEDVHITLEADGVNIPLEPDNSVESDNMITYKIQSMLTDGQELVLEAKADGLPDVIARTVMPASLPKVCVTHEFIQSYKDSDPDQTISSYMNTLSRFKVEIAEEPKKNSYFGIQVVRQKKYEFVGDVPDHEREMYVDGEEQIDDIYVNAQIPEGGALSSVKNDMVVLHKGGELLVCPADRDKNSSVVNVDVDGKERRMVSGHGDFDNWEYATYEYYRYRIKVFRLSPEMYHCIRARYIADYSDAPLHLGFTPVTYTYTNVEGGLGMFGAVSAFETDWINVD